MSRIIMACVLAGISCASAFGQSTLREQLVGAWALVSCRAQPPRALMCENPNGIWIFDASSHYAGIYAARGHPKLSGSPPLTSPAEEIKTLVTGFAGNFGTWSVNEADKTITYHFDGALIPNVEGTNFKTGTVSISGDELRIGPDVFQRIKK